MVIRQRAIQAVDKEVRHRAILDAAERLLLRSPDRVASVAEVADEAGLGKGTVYLYFASKEELLLAVHERNLDAFFGALHALLERDTPFTFADLVAVTADHIVRPPLFLPLAVRCIALMAQSIPAEAAVAFHARMAARLERGGAALERRFTRLAPGDGVAKLRHSFALILGLWQMSAASGCSARPESVATVPAAATSPVFKWSYPDELARALAGLWQSVIGPPPAAAA